VLAVAFAARPCFWKATYNMSRIDRLPFGKLTAALVVVLACVPLAIPAGPDDSKPPSNDREASSINVRRPPLHTLPIQVDVDLVLVNATVTDPYDRIVTGLEESNFQVFDDKVPQQIVSFSTEDAPISVGLIFDSSGSMADKIQQSRQAVLQFFKTSNPQDEFMLINFNERPRLRLHVEVRGPAGQAAPGQRGWQNGITRRHLLGPQ